MHEVRATAHMHVRALHTHLHAPVNHAAPLDLSFECCVGDNFPPPPAQACKASPSPAGLAYDIACEADRYICFVLCFFIYLKSTVLCL